MDGYSAYTREPVAKCLEDVASADVYLGLFAFRYGSIPPGQEKSITELEFRTAEKQGLKRLIFVVPDDANWPMNLVDQGDTGVPMCRFRKELMAQNGFTIANFVDETDLLTKLPQAIEALAPSGVPQDTKRTIKAPYHDFLKPLNYDAESRRHLHRFTGRQWIDKRLDDWIHMHPDSRVFCLVGSPGIGKSALAYHWCNSRADIVAYHYCVYGHAEKTDPARMLLSQAAQMAVNLPEYEARLSVLSFSDLQEAIKAGARSIFDNLWAKCLGGSFPSPDGVRLVVIDGIDEASDKDTNVLAQLIGDVWAGAPEWLRLLVTSRPECQIMDYLGNLHPFILRADGSENLMDIRMFLNSELVSYGTEDIVIDQIVAKSEGMFLYANLVLDEIHSKLLSLDNLAEFPEGLTGYYRTWFARKFQCVDEYHRDFHSLVSVIVAQKAPLPLTVLASATGLSRYELDQRLLRLGVLFPKREEVPGQQSSQVVTLMHKSLFDWLTQLDSTAPYHPRARSFAANIDIGNSLLADEGWRLYEAGKLLDSPYFRATITAHLTDAKITERIVRMLLDPALLESYWSVERRCEWQHHISVLRYSLSLSHLVNSWLREHTSAEVQTIGNAAAAARLGRLFQEAGAYDEALTLCEAALRIWREHNVEDAPEMVDSLLAIGRILTVRDNLEAASLRYKTARNIAERAYHQDSPQMGEVLYQLCIFYTQGKRDYTMARECKDKCFFIRSKMNPPDYAGMATCINDEAVLLEAEGKTGNYHTIYQEALTLFEKAPKQDPEMIATLCNLGRELHREGRHHDAVTEYRRAVSLAHEITLPQHEHSRYAHAGLASTLISVGNYGEALDVARQFLVELERYPGPDHDDTASARLSLCNVLWMAIRLSDGSEAIAIRNELQMQCQNMRSSSPVTLLGLLELADNAQQVGDSSAYEFARIAVCRAAHGRVGGRHSTSEDAEAARNIAEVVDAVVSKDPTKDICLRVQACWERTAPLLQAQGDCLPRTRKYVVALTSWLGRSRFTQYRDVDDLLATFDAVDTIGAESPETLDHLASLTISLHHAHNDEQSENLCRRLMEKSGHILGPDHIQTLQYTENLAHLTTHVGKYAEAASLYQDAMTRRGRIGGLEQLDTLGDICRLAKCLLLQDKSTEAQMLIRDLTSRLTTGVAYTSARPTLSHLLNGVGVELKNEFGDFHGAKVCYELAIEMDPCDGETHSNLAMLLWTCLDNPESACINFRESVRLAPHQGTFHSNYGQFLAQTIGELELAQAQFDEALRLAPNDSAAVGNYASLALLRGDIESCWRLVDHSYRICLADPDRIMARPLLCLTAILMLNSEDTTVPLGQLRTLFTQGIDHAPWIITALLTKLSRLLQPQQIDLLRAISNAIDSTAGWVQLQHNPQWLAILPVSLTATWPKYLH
jgi:tetratricopeptide (TPR) repeat protein